MGKSGVKASVTLMLTHNYYRRIMILCFALMLVLLFVQAGVGFFILRDQTIRHSSTLSEKILGELSGQTSAYFNTLDQVLDAVYQYPDFLSGLETSSRDKQEYPVRSLLSQTAYFRPLRCIWVYDMQHAVRGCYSRSGANMYRQDSLDIYRAPEDPAATLVRTFAEGDGARFRVFCCEGDGGNVFLRAVKRVYQDMGRRQVGYIVCDLQPLALEDIAASAITSANQYAWLYTPDGAVCGLPTPDSARVRSFMQRRELFDSPFSGMTEGNYFCCSEAPDTGMTVCLFTDEIELRQSLSRLLRLTLSELAALLLLSGAFAVALSRRVNRRIRGVTDVFHRIEQGETHLRLPADGRDEIDAICSRFNSMMDHMEITTAEEARLRRAFEEARYQSLQAQVNPHFLFNTMENIGAIALAQGCDTVDDMCIALSGMLRYSIGSDGPDRTVSLGEELEYVRQYMLIINVRMNHEILLDVSVPEALLDTRLPRLSIQPLADNAIRHGLRRKRGEKRLNILARPVGGDVEVVVENNGLAGDIDEMNRIIRREITKDAEHTSIGICNIHERVQLLFGIPYGLRAASEDGTTQMILLLPGNKEGKATCAEEHC